MLLEWVLILEGLALAILAIMGLIGMFIRKGEGNEPDPIVVFCSVFWKEFLWPPTVMAIDGGGRQTSGRSRGSSSRPVADDASDDESFYGRKGSDAKTDLAVLVVPHAPNDSVLGRDGEGIRLQVTGEPGDSKSNKTLIELVATAIGVQPYQVTLTKGHYHPRKTVQVQGLSEDELRMRISGMNEAE